MKKSYHVLCAVFALVMAGCSGRSLPPAAIAPLPQPKQVEWQKMETYAFVHFGLNTFNDKEWGYGDTDPAIFNPQKLDCRQWVKTFVQAGMTGVILTAKHHDGFCLWPTELTEYCIRNAPYKNGKGDIVKELAEACKEQNLKFAVYLSPWDRNRADYGTPAYVDYFHQQLRELMTNYGPVFEVWFDGANGGDGWYGGAKETRQIDHTTYYNFPKIHQMLDELQPQAIIFSDGGPGCRWAGNEQGSAGETNWAFIKKGTIYPGTGKREILQHGDPEGDLWVPAECDVSIRPGWFYHPDQDSRVKTPRELLDLYYRSVGRNATLLLNFPINRDGLISPIDSANAVEFHKMLTRELSENLLHKIPPRATATRGRGFHPTALTDGKWETYWATPDSVLQASVEFKFEKPEKVNRLMLQEYIPLGQRVQAFSVEYLSNGQWAPVNIPEATTTIGYKRLLRFPTVEAMALRINFNRSRGPLCINNIEVYYAGEGSMEQTNELKKLTGIPFSLVGVDKEEAAKCTDRDSQTYTLVKTDSVVFDLGEAHQISSFSYLPDQGARPDGMVTHYELYAKQTLNDTGIQIAQGEFSNIRNNPIMQTVSFEPLKTRFVMLKAVKELNGKKHIGMTEVIIH